MKETTLKIIIFILALALWIITTTTAKGDPDFYHHRNILPGARASAMGGAFTAVSDDPSGAYYNPSGLAFGKQKEVSISVNSRQEKTIRFKGIKALNNKDFIERSSTFFPSFVGSSYRFGLLSVGWSYLTLDTSNIDQSDRFIDLNQEESNILKNYTRTHQESNSYFLAGTSFALPIGKHFSLGASFYYYRRDIIATNHQLVQLVDGSFLVSDQKYTTLNEGLLPIYGAMLKFDQWSFGLSYRKPERISDHTILHTDGVSYIASQANAVPQINSEVFKLKSYDEVNPETAQCGFAWFPSQKFLIAFDIIHHFASDSPSEIKESNLVATFNYALGMELEIGMLQFRGGFFTNNSQAKELQTDKVNQPTHIDYLGHSLSAGVKQKGFSGNITLVEQNGVGKSQKLSDDKNIQEVIGYSRTVQLGATYDF